MKCPECESVRITKNMGGVVGMHLCKKCGSVFRCEHKYEYFNDTTWGCVLCGNQIPRR